MNNNHNHLEASNTEEVFSTFIGCQVRGVVHDRRGDTVILVFHCGYGLAFKDNGSHWVETPPGIKGIIARSREELDATKKELEHILRLADE